MDPEIVYFLNFVFDQTYRDQERPDFDEFCANYLSYMKEVQEGKSEMTDILRDGFEVLTRRLIEASQEESRQSPDLSVVEELSASDEMLQNQS